MTNLLVFDGSLPIEYWLIKTVGCYCILFTWLLRSRLGLLLSEFHSSRLMMDNVPIKLMRFSEFAQWSLPLLRFYLILRIICHLPSI